MKQVILVTGGAGYVGSHICKAVAQAGYLPVVYDNLTQGHRWAVKWGPFEMGDVADTTHLDEVMARYRPQAVMHFAAHIAAGESMVSPDKYYRNNVVGLLGLLSSMRTHDVKRFVFSSTAAVYGTPIRVPIDEDHPKAPINPYGSSKLTCEMILADFAGAYGLRPVSLRYFNAAGADPDGDLGEAHDPETHLIPAVLSSAHDRRAHFAIYGDDYDTHDGTCVRDFVHVTDIADAHLLALQQLDRAGRPLCYNLGNGQGYSVREVLDVARKVTGRRILAKVERARPGDPPILLADTRRAREELGWKPQFEALEDQITHAWRWLTYRRRVAAGAE